MNKVKYLTSENCNKLSQMCTYQTLQMSVRLCTKQAYFIRNYNRSSNFNIKSELVICY